MPSLHYALIYYTSSLSFMLAQCQRICLKFCLYQFVKLNITQNVRNNHNKYIYYYYCNSIIIFIILIINKPFLPKSEFTHVRIYIT